MGKANSKRERLKWSTMRINCTSELIFLYTSLVDVVIGLYPVIIVNNGVAWWQLISQGRVISYYTPDWSIKRILNRKLFIYGICCTVRIYFLNVECIFAPLPFVTVPANSIKQCNRINKSTVYTQTKSDRDREWEKRDKDTHWGPPSSGTFAVHFL